MKFFTKLNPPKGSQIDQAGQKSRTRQSEKDNCDINKIMERFNRSGKLPTMQSAPPRYGDAIAPDYATSLNIVKDAQSRFMSLSAAARKHFDHNPQRFLEALQDSSKENQQKLLKLGILIEVQPSEKELLTDLVKATKETKKQDAEKPGNS